jgi:hypothetical protein
VNKNKNPIIQTCEVLGLTTLPISLTIHLKILIPVGTAIIIVAVVKYIRVSMSSPTLNMWWAQTTQPRTPILIIAKNIPVDPKGVGFPLLIVTACLTRPNPGKIKI